jgi:hypothetical protein
VRLPKLWNLVVFSIPLLLLWISFPLAIANHTQPPPTVRFARFLKNQYPPDERKDVLLFLQESRRTMEWYAPEFSLGSASGSAPERRSLESARAAYTDEPTIELPEGWGLKLVASFTRSDLISPKQSALDLYKIERE